MKKTIDRINIHKKQTQHDILKETINKKTENMFYIARGGGGGGGTPLKILGTLFFF